MSEHSEPVRREVLLAATPDQVWSALTRAPELSAWFQADVEIDARPGGAVRFRFPDGAERRGLIGLFEPHARLGIRWRDTRAADEPSDAGFALEEVRGGAHLVVAGARGIPSADTPLVARARWRDTPPT